MGAKRRDLIPQPTTIDQIDNIDMYNPLEDLFANKSHQFSLFH